MSPKTTLAGVSGPEVGRETVGYGAGNAEASVEGGEQGLQRRPEPQPAIAGESAEGCPRWVTGRDGGCRTAVVLDPLGQWCVYVTMASDCFRSQGWSGEACLPKTPISNPSGTASRGATFSCCPSPLGGSRPTSLYLLGGSPRRRRGGQLNHQAGTIQSKINFKMKGTEISKSSASFPLSSLS